MSPPDDGATSKTFEAWMHDEGAYFTENEFSTIGIFPHKC
jgi:hypothetical protein